MKLILTLTAALIGGVALPALTFAGTTEDITGCATVADPATNFTTFADPTCYRAPEPSGSASLVAVAAFAFEAVLPDEEEPAAE